MVDYTMKELLKYIDTLELKKIVRSSKAPAAVTAALAILNMRGEIPRPRPGQSIFEIQAMFNEWIDEVDREIRNEQSAPE